MFDYPDCYAVKYEDIKSNPTSSFLRIFNFLQIENNQGPLQYYRENLVHPLNNKTNQKVYNAQKIIDDRRPVYETWDNEKKRVFKDICGTKMKELNYEIPF